MVHASATDTDFTLCVGQLSGPRTDGYPHKGKFVSTEEYVPAPGSGALPHPPQPSCELIDPPSIYVVPSLVPLICSPSSH